MHLHEHYQGWFRWEAKNGLMLELIVLRMLHEEWKQSRIRLFESVYSIEKREREYSTYRNTVKCIVLMLVTIDPICRLVNVLFGYRQNRSRRYYSMDIYNVSYENG